MFQREPSVGASTNRGRGRFGPKTPPPIDEIPASTILIADVDSKGGLAELVPTVRQRVIDAYGAALDTAVANAGGTVFALRGSAAYASFDTTVDAVAAAEATQRVVGRSGADGPGLRMAIDVGDVESRADGEVAGPPLSRSRGLVAAAWGGQVLLSAEAQTDLSESREAGWQIKALGSHSIQGLGAETADARCLSLDQPAR